MDTETHKPEITRKDASYHLATAAHEARKKAEQEGASPHDVDAVVSSEPVTIGPFVLHRMSARVAWAMEAIDMSAQRAKRDVGAMETLALMVFSYTDPKAAYQLAKGNDWETLEVTAWSIAEKLTPEVNAQVSAYLKAESDRVKKLNGDTEDEPGKSLPVPRAAPAT